MATNVSMEMKSKAEEQIRKLQKAINFDTKDYPIELINLGRMISIHQSTKENLFGMNLQKTGLLNLYYWDCLYHLCFFQTLKMGAAK